LRKENGQRRKQKNKIKVRDQIFTFFIKYILVVLLYGKIKCFHLFLFIFTEKQNEDIMDGMTMNNHVTEPINVLNCTDESFRMTHVSLNAPVQVYLI
jgi:hypothetical protein